MIWQESNATFVSTAPLFFNTLDLDPSAKILGPNFDSQPNLGLLDFGASWVESFGVNPP